MKRVSDEEINRAYNKAWSKVRRETNPSNEAAALFAGTDAIAQAQLESCEEAHRGKIQEIMADIRSRTTNKDYIFYCVGERVISLNTYLGIMVDALEKKYCKEKK